MLKFLTNFTKVILLNRNHLKVLWIETIFFEMPGRHDQITELNLDHWEDTRRLYTTFIQSRGTLTKRTGLYDHYAWSQ